MGYFQPLIDKYNKIYLFSIQYYLRVSHKIRKKDYLLIYNKLFKI